MDRDVNIMIVSRDRPEMLKRTLPQWREVQKADRVVVITEPDQLEAYEDVCYPLGAAVIGHAEQDAGMGYARQSCLEAAFLAGFESFIMADDDMMIKGRKKDDPPGNVRSMLDVVNTDTAMFCGAWLSVHSGWYGKENGLRDDIVIPRFCDMIMAVNTRLALEAGGWDRRFVYNHGNNEMWRRSVRAGYLWWICPAVWMHDLKPDGLTKSFFADDEEAKRRQRAAHEIEHELWPDYVSHPDKRYSTRKQQMIKDFIGEEAADVAKACTPFPIGGELPYRTHDAYIEPGYEERDVQEALFDGVDG